MIGAINEQPDYAKTRNYWKYLKTKLKADKNEVVSATNQLKLLAPDGNTVGSRCARKSYKDEIEAGGPRWSACFIFENIKYQISNFILL